MSKSIPVLTDAVGEEPDVSGKPSRVFQATFWHVEVKRQALAGYGYKITRLINLDTDGGTVTYAFPPLNGKAMEQMVLKETNPFDTRHVILNLLDEITAYLIRVKQVNDARMLLEKTLTPTQLAGLRQLSQADIAFAVSGSILPLV